MYVHPGGIENSPRCPAWHSDCWTAWNCKSMHGKMMQMKHMHAFVQLTFTMIGLLDRERPSLAARSGDAKLHRMHFGYLQDLGHQSRMLPCPNRFNKYINLGRYIGDSFGHALQALLWHRKFFFSLLHRAKRCQTRWSGECLSSCNQRQPAAKIQTDRGKQQSLRVTEVAPASLRALPA